MRYKFYRLLGSAFFQWTLIVSVLIGGTGLVVVGIPVYLHLSDGRPLCLPNLPPRGNDPPQSLPAFSAPEDLPIPRQDDWLDYGPVLETGAEGEWDFFWAGLTPASVVKKDGTYYFYYVAADGYRSFDGDARHRAVGVATSHDGIRFAKYENNPIMTHRPYDGEEEGANSAGVTLDEDGRFVMAYGAAYGPYDTIVADGRFAYSDDGLSFTDAGRSLFHCNMRLYGFGDEIFPIAVIRQDDRWIVYYYPNGIRGTERTLGAAWGPALDRLNNSSMVLNAASGGVPVDTWGNVIPLEDETLVFFNQRLWWPDTFVEVRVASSETPYHLSDPITRYDIPNLKRGVVFLDKERRTWFMYYNDFSRYWYVKLAPYGPIDHTPPSPPAALTAVSSVYDQVELAWEPASDPDTGVAEYRIYRDGEKIARTIDLAWVDTGFTEFTHLTYAVTAVNFHGIEGPSITAAVTTTADTVPPTLDHVSIDENLSSLRVVFDQEIDPVSASKPANYRISDDLNIISVTLDPDGRTVILDTEPHQPNTVYTLTVESILDRAMTPNVMATTARRYTASPIGGLVGRWLSTPHKNDQTPDLSGFGRDGQIEGAASIAERPGALHFDGVGNYVQIAGDGHLRHLTAHSFTMSGWVRADAVPATSNGASIIGRVGEHPAYSYAVSLTPEQRLRARIFVAGESWHQVVSPQIELGTWYHVAMAADAVEQRLYLYVNGSPVEDSPRALDGDLVELLGDSPRDDRSGAYYFGSAKPDRGAGGFFDAYFNGAIADVRFYNRALDMTEIQAIIQE